MGGDLSLAGRVWLPEGGDGAERLGEIRGGLVAVNAVGCDGLEQDGDEAGSEVLEAGDVSGVTRDFVFGRGGLVGPGVFAGDSLIEGDPQSVKVAIGAVGVGLFGGEVEVGREVAAGAAAAGEEISGADGDVEIHDFDGRARPHQVGGFDVAMGDVVAMEVSEAVGNLDADLVGLGDGEFLVLDEAVEAGAFDIFHDEIGDGVAFEAGAVKHPDHAGVLGQIGEGAVLLPHPLHGGSAIGGDNLERAGGFAVDINDLVNATKPAFAEGSLDLELIHQQGAGGEIGVVERRAERRGFGFGFGGGSGRWSEEGVVTGECVCRRGAVGGFEATEGFEPSVEAFRQASDKRRGFFGEDLSGGDGLVELVEGGLAGEEFVNRRASSVNVGGGAALQRIVFEFGGEVGGLDSLGQFVGQGALAGRAGAGKVEVHQTGAEVATKDEGGRGDGAVQDAAGVAMGQGLQQVPGNAQLLVHRAVQGRLGEMDAEAIAGRVVQDQDVGVAAVGGEKIAGEWNAGVRRQPAQSGVGVGDAFLLGLALVGG